MKFVCECIECFCNEYVDTEDTECDYCVEGDHNWDDEEE